MSEPREGTPPSSLLTLATDVAREAGALLLDYARRHAEGALVQDTKSSATDPVSEADRATEQLIIDRLLAARPDDGFLGEEDRGNRDGTTGLRWVVDPLDGTVNFLYGIPSWCISIAVEDREGSVAGVVYDPNRDELFSALRGGGASCNGRALAVTTQAELSQTMVATGFAYPQEVRELQGPIVAELAAMARDVRRYGAAALDLAWVAAGRFDAYVEFGLKRWDWASGTLLVTEAGGHVTMHEATLAGHPMVGVVAGGPAAHATLDPWTARSFGSRPVQPA